MSTSETAIPPLIPTPTEPASVGISDEEWVSVYVVVGFIGAIFVIPMVVGVIIWAYNRRHRAQTPPDAYGTVAMEPDLESDKCATLNEIGDEQNIYSLSRASTASTPTLARPPSSVCTDYVNPRREMEASLQRHVSV